MLRNYYINKEWILSTTARRIYRTAAVAALAFPFLLIWLATLDEVPAALELMVKLALWAGILGTATTVVAMEYFFFGFDRTSAWKKTFWFLIMCLPPIGTALYCFCVYSKAEAVHKTEAEVVSQSSMTRS